jgi:membrane protein required for colicin V production
MQTIDIVILLPILYGLYKGWRRGIMIEVVSIIAFVLAIIVAFKFLGEATFWLGQYIQNPLTQRILPYMGFAVLFLPIVFIINKIGWLLRSKTKASLVGNVDSAAGAIVGACTWAIGVSVVLWVLAGVGVQFDKKPKQSSILYPYISPIAPKVINKTTDFVQKTDFKAWKQRLKSETSEN